MSSIKPVPFIIGVMALIASAIFWLMYMGNGIAYGSLVGLKGRESDLQALASRGMVGLAAAAIFQITAWVAFRFSWSPVAGTKLRGRVTAWAVAIPVALAGTVVLIAIFVSLNRLLKLV